MWCGPAAWCARTSCHPLPPALHALLSPVRLEVEGPEVRARLEEALLLLVDLPSVATRRELRTKAWELEQVGGWVVQPRMWGADVLASDAGP